MTPGDTALFLFETATHVIWAEEVAQEEGMPVDVIPAPEGVEKVCGLALRTLREWAPALESLLDREGIEFRRHS